MSVEHGPIEPVPAGSYTTLYKSFISLLNNGQLSAHAIELAPYTIIVAGMNHINTDPIALPRQRRGANMFMGDQLPKNISQLHIMEPDAFNDDEPIKLFLDEGDTDYKYYVGLNKHIVHMASECPLEMYIRTAQLACIFALAQEGRYAKGRHSDRTKKLPTIEGIQYLRKICAHGGTDANEVQTSPFLSELMIALPYWFD